MHELEKKIGYTFKNRSHLETALTHSSYANENHCSDNERYEFLGDSILSLVVSEKLFRDFRSENEGVLSKTRASIVCEEGLCEIAEKIDLQDFIRLGKGEGKTGGRNRPSIISDAFEALIAAVFLDSDFETVKAWLLGLLPDELKTESGNDNFGDYKSMLQEILQKNGDCDISYSIVDESGPDHDKRFTCAVSVNGKTLAEGVGKGKKSAEQEAAKRAIELL